MDKFCRICLRADDFRKFDLSTLSQISGLQIEDMLVYCTQIEVANKANFPQQICDECLAALSAAYVFKKLCYRAEANIREMLKSRVSDVLPEPSLEYELNLSDVEIPEAASYLGTGEGYCTIAAGAAVVQPEQSYSAVASGEEQYQGCIMAEQTNSGLPKETLTVSEAEDDGCESQQTPTMSIFRVWTCNECAHTANSPHNLKRHQRVLNHTGSSSSLVRKKTPTLFHCNDCSYHTMDQASFQQHQAMTGHRNIVVHQFQPATGKVRQCPTCGKHMPGSRYFAHKRACEKAAAEWNISSNNSPENPTTSGSLGPSDEGSQSMLTTFEETTELAAAEEPGPIELEVKVEDSTMADEEDP